MQLQNKHIGEKIFNDSESNIYNIIVTNTNATYKCIATVDAELEVTYGTANPVECTTSELQQSSTTENRDFMLNMKENVAYTPSAAVPLQVYH